MRVELTIYLAAAQVIYVSHFRILLNYCNHLGTEGQSITETYTLPPTPVEDSDTNDSSVEGVV